MKLNYGDTMNIIMIGESGVGKTTYMASSYGNLKNGLDLGGKIFLHENLKIGTNQYLEDIYDNYESYNMSGTVKPNKYELDIIWNKRCVLSFNWVDIKGGDIHSDINTDEYNYLANLLVEANSIMAFFSCEDIDNMLRGLDTNGTIAEQVKRLVTLINRTIDNRTSGTTVVIILTKVDLRPHSQRSISTFFNQEFANIPNTKVNCFFVASVPKHEKNVTIPLLELMTLGIIQQLDHDRTYGTWKERHDWILVRRMTACAKGLCDYLYRSTRDRMWIDESSRL